MKAYEIGPAQDRVTNWENEGKIRWLLKTGTTFANVNEDLLKKIKEAKKINKNNTTI